MSSSPDGVTNTEIGFIISDRKGMIYDVTVPNKCTIGGGHRAEGPKLITNSKKRRKLIKTHSEKKLGTIQKADQYRNPLEANLSALVNFKDDMDIRENAKKEAEDNCYIGGGRTIDKSSIIQLVKHGSEL